MTTIANAYPNTNPNTYPNTANETTRKTTMRALVLADFGSELALADLPRPVPAPGEVLVRVAASGVNPLDTKIRVGAADHAEVALPAVLGIDLAGTVVELGAGTEDRFAVGDEVYGMTGGVGPHQGSLAEYAAVDANLLAPKAARLSMLEAAALPLAVITAWEGLVDRAGVSPGDLVLVHGGGGGVGSIAVQVALARGAIVFATEVGAGLDAVRALGAEPIDASSVTVEEYVGSATGGDGFDVVFDTRGGATLDASFTAVREHTGRVVSILGWGSHSLAPLSFRGASYSGVFTLLPLLTGRGRAHHGEILREATALVDAGRLAPRLAPERYDWASVMDAHHAVERGAAGKVVVDLSGPALPPAVSSYLRGDRARDLDVALGAFAATASVTDQDQTYLGVGRIEQWLTTTWALFSYTVAPLSSETDEDGTVVVRVRLEGDFPGAVVDLDYRFTLHDSQIAALEITPA
ncbi:MAG TPA: zinc-dependent alcohol dehydrogenase family protein [Nocardioides sp.]|uniref:zinc-dependent alcohol dehydrogenase family protein n=1 Tax=Nocardioides sp. TaxID=35761 RepID=UPI002E3717E5|nr:zinc-dependent alcohol dehydrogenase family protein [Nocardioides sp.]HEX3929318.1 zinc-dependent alcohol dehydrogenase family protein [Nocardioides sp.]